MHRGNSIILAVLLAGILTYAAQASDIGHEIAAQVDVASYQHFLDDVLYTHYGDDRGADGPEHDLARDNIAATFESYGFQVELHAFDDDDAPPGPYYNVVATKIGVIWPDRQYIVGAHYDSGNNPGADDDASGVAGLLELARVYSQYKTGCTLKLIAFDLEEWGRLGSEAYAAERCHDDIRGMIQLDMIAWDYLRYKVMICPADYPLPQLLYDLDLAIDEYGGELLGAVGSLNTLSDHASFAIRGIPACLLTEHRQDLNPCYHRPCDSVDEPNYISYDYAADIVRSVAGYLADVAPAYDADDCNQDGVSDTQQIQNDPSLDCNENGLLDECEPGGSEDCNGNGMPDFCDIYAGTSDDLDENTVPDECQPHRHVPTEYATIQAAVDAADAGDVIVVADGTYTGAGNIDVDFLGKDLVLRSESGPHNCVIDCAGAGRGFYLGNGETSAAVICGFTITNGYSSTAGGAIACGWTSPRIVDCIMTNNEALDGGAVYCVWGRPTIRQCTIAQNTATAGGGVCNYISRLTIDDSVISDNTAVFGGGIYQEGGASIVLTRCTVEGNVAIERGGGLDGWCADGLSIRDSRIANNSSGGDGGGIYYLHLFDNPLLISTSEICGNRALDSGGGVQVQTNGTVRIDSCLISGNAAVNEGGGIWAYCEETLLTNCTIVRNRALGIGGGLYVYWYLYPVITNTILWYNLPDEVSADGFGIVTYSAIQGGWEGTGNIDADPLFVDADGPDDNPNTWEDNDFRLNTGSPCSDAADNTAVLPDLMDLDDDRNHGERVPFDLDGNPRFVENPFTPNTGVADPPIYRFIADMGAYEFQICLGDLDQSGEVGYVDVVRLLEHYGVQTGATYYDGDLDGDGDVDLADLAGLLSQYGMECP